MFVRHQVRDYPAWKAVYDALEPTRVELGAGGHDVFQAIGDPNDVTVWHDFESQEAAESFASSSQLREAMEEAGVEGIPDIWFATPGA